MTDPRWIELTRERRDAIWNLTTEGGTASEVDLVMVKSIGLSYDTAEKRDPDLVVCPREKTFMTPCVARDGQTACADDGKCVGCGAEPAELLKALVHLRITEKAKR